MEEYCDVCDELLEACECEICDGCGENIDNEECTCYEE